MTAGKSEIRNQKSEGSQKSERRTEGCRNVRITKHLRYFAGLLPEACDDRDMARKSEAQPGSVTRRSRRFIRLKSLRIPVFCGKKSYP
jgi:hypothetical protein